MLPDGSEAAPPSVESSLPELGAPLAAQGVVVMVAQYRGQVKVAGGYPVTFQDVACAIGVARKIGPTYRADPARVTLVGYSWGAWAGAVVALTPTPFTPTAGACNPTTGSLRPDAFVGLEGWFSVAQETPPQTIQVPSVYADAATRAAATAASDPYQLAKTYPAGSGALAIHLLHGSADQNVDSGVSTSFAAALTAGGYANSLWFIPGADIESALSVDSTIAWIHAYAKGP